MDQLSRLVARVALWRVKHISQTQFVLILSLVIGVLSGFAAVVLKNTIHLVRILIFGSASAAELNILLLILPMLGILITVLIVRYLIKDSLSHGVSKILYAISKSGGFIKPHNTFSNVLASTFTIALGGSVGAEAPIVLSGSAIGSNLGRIFRLNHKAMVLLIGCGAAGAIAGIFQAPIAGVIFVLEVLMLDLTTSSIAPLLIAAISGTAVSYFFLGKDAEFSFLLNSPFDLNHIPFYILLGIFGGLVAFYFNWSVITIEKQYAKINYWWLKWLVGGSILSVLLFLFPPLYGEGYHAIHNLFNNDLEMLLSESIFFGMQQQTWAVISFLTLLLLLKVIATASTNGSGGVGGVFAPSLFMGGISGYLFAKIVNTLGWVRLSESNFALAGMAALMAAIMHAPLTAIFLIAEITNGYELLIPLMISSTVAYLTIKQFQTHNIYTERLAEKGELITHHKDKAVLTLMKLHSVIETDFYPIKPRMLLGDLVKVVSQSRRNIFPVTNAQDQLIGIVVLDDIRLVMFNQSLYQKTTVQDVMTLPPDFVDIDDNMDAVMDKFEKTGAWNLPVIEEGKYVGFVSKSKILSAYRKVLIHYSDE